MAVEDSSCCLACRPEIEIAEDGITFRLKRENLLVASKRVLVHKLCSLLPSRQEKENFIQVCQCLEELIYSNNRDMNEELRELYDLFNPSGARKPVDNDNVEKKTRFLKMFLEVMAKCRFSVLSDSEWKLATSSTYLFRLHAKINKSKLSDHIFEDFEDMLGFELPTHCERKFLIFRRGIGVDEKTGYFFRAKCNEAFQRFWDRTIMRLWEWMRNDGEEGAAKEQSRKGTSSEYCKNADQYDSVKRVHISSSFKMSKFFEPLHLQEPTFGRVVLMYSPASILASTIHLKHYTSIPMADIELILPEKSSPKLPAFDWMMLFLTALVAAVLIVTSYEDHHPHRFGAALVLGIVSAFLSYCAKVYYTFNQNLLEYERLVSRLMHDKQLDCGHGALLHICEEATELEVKEAIIACFVLMQSGGTSDSELCHRCNDLLRTLFGEEEKCVFQAEELITGLLRNSVIIRDDCTGQFKLRETGVAYRAAA